MSLRARCEDAFWLGFGIAVGGILAGVCGYALCGCSSSSPRATEVPPARRAETRAAILAVGHAIVAADSACSELARVRHDLALGERCGAIYQTGRSAVFVAEMLLDAADVRGAACATKHGAHALEELARAVRSSGGVIPWSVEDGAAMAQALERRLPCNPATAGL